MLDTRSMEHTANECGRFRVVVSEVNTAQTLTSRRSRAAAAPTFGGMARSQRTSTRTTRQGTPRESGRAATRAPARSARSASLPSAGVEDWRDGFDWYTFVCTGCGEETHVGKSPDQSVEDFSMMTEWIHGDPPLCSACLNGESAA